MFDVRASRTVTHMVLNYLSLQETPVNY